ncbi:Dabb family protein [Subtercola boreus]|uniref:Stress-response A/B barrel domain-containing protein n=1 Tax=Subtercola boreus TaxID=120213 RepID=A0A3E0WGP6_9MICO|nr:Dabb family protein [Subtercola boreus]RFA23638.1 hypothetical protein B7R24_01830 [Subtercola boreus]RFA24032.1 hypothetical protein B7R23_01830 [Subtercola boreus]RFA29731.1 hypothetical protein B7R25_01825 [Subtercola boreus]
MIRHIVTFTLAATSPEERREHADFVASQLTSLVGLVPEVLSLEVVHDVEQTAGNAHVALIADYDDQAALDRYQANPDHVRVSTSIKPLFSGRAAIDFEV